MNSIAPSIADQMTQIYVFVDDYLKAHHSPGQALRSEFVPTRLALAGTLPQ